MADNDETPRNQDASVPRSGTCEHHADMLAMATLAEALVQRQEQRSRRIEDKLDAITESLSKAHIAVVMEKKDVKTLSDVVDALNISVKSIKGVRWQVRGLVVAMMGGYAWLAWQHAELIAIIRMLSEHVGKEILK